MSAEALPYTLLILLAELAAGGLWVLWAAHWRGTSAPSFVKFSVWLVPVMAGIGFWLAAALDVKAEVDGYPVDTSYMGEARLAVLAMP